MSKDATSPKAGILVSDSDGKVEKEKGEMLVLALTAKKGRVKITDIQATTSDVDTADFTALYLYDGTNPDPVASIGATDGTNQTFSDLTNLYVEKDTTKLLTIKADFVSATSTSFVTSTVAVERGGISAETGDGTEINLTGGTATSSEMRVTALAPVLSLVSATASYSRPGQESTGTLTGTFVFDLTASGGDVYVSSTGAFTFQYVTTTAADVAAAGVNYSQPTNASAVGSQYKIAENQTARFIVNMSKADINSSSANWGVYNYLQLSNVAWYRDGSNTAGTAIDFLDTTVWRSNSVLVN